MLKVKKNKITLTRGDTLRLNLTLMNGNEEYELQAGDRVRFALKHPEYNTDGTDFADTEPLIVKQMEGGVLVLQPEDTKELGFGNYVYDVELTYANGDVDTVIPPTAFILAPEVK